MPTFCFQVHLEHDHNAVQSLPGVRLTTHFAHFNNEFTKIVTKILVFHIFKTTMDVVLMTFQLCPQIPCLLPVVEDAESPANLTLTCGRETARTQSEEQLEKPNMHKAWSKFDTSCSTHMPRQPKTHIFLCMLRRSSPETGSPKR